jgi:hypothetical protein
MANVFLQGWPEVWAADIFQISNGTPGTILIDTLVSNDGSIMELPRYTSLSITSSEGTVAWTNIKVVKSPRQFGRYMRTVFQDGRHILPEIVMGVNYNLYDCNGEIYPETEKTLEELWDAIIAACGLPIQYRELPTLKPQAAWRGKTLDVAINELLVTTGCRMVYRPSDQTYQVSPGGYGVLPDAKNRVYRDPPFHGYSKLIVQSFPKTFEALLSCKAKVRDEEGELVDIDATKGKGIFNNFKDIEDEKEKANYSHAAYRVWVPDGLESKMLIGRRALSIGPGDDEPVYAAPYIKKTDEESAVPIYSHMVQPPGFSVPPLSLTFGGTAFQSSHPHVMVTAGGDISDEATVLCAYHAITGGKLERESEEFELQGEGGDAVVIQDWIRPVSSPEGEIEGEAWEALLTEVAQAISRRYVGAPEHIEYPTIINHMGIGQVGGVRYTAMSGMRSELKTSLAVNFEPADARLL